MEFYLSSAQDWEPYDDLKNNELMQKYLREIEKESDAKVTFEKDTVFEGYQHIVVDIPSMKALAQIMKAIGIDNVKVGKQQFVDEDHKYPTILICDR